jgi:hypothetical protein
MLRELLAVFHIPDLDIVAARAVIPIRSYDLMLGLDVIFEVILVGKVVKILENLSAAGIDPRPVQLWLETPCVVMRRHIARASNLSSATNLLTRSFGELTLGIYFRTTSPKLLGFSQKLLKNNC